MSPYFSVKNAIAPAAIASLYFISRVVTGRFSQMCVFTVSSTRASVASSTGPWCAKSKRSRSGATTDPCCRTWGPRILRRDRKSTRLNSSHGYISYAVFCLKKKKKRTRHSSRCTQGPDRISESRRDKGHLPVWYSRSRSCEQPTAGDGYHSLARDGVERGI